jgi:hypothetical protein
LGVGAVATALMFRPCLWRGTSSPFKTEKMLSFARHKACTRCSDFSAMKIPLIPLIGYLAFFYLAWTLALFWYLRYVVAVMAIIFRYSKSL